MKVRAIVIAAAVLATVQAAFADDAADIVKRGKKATVLVQGNVGVRKGSGTAFCIDPAGYFVTNEHVAKLGATDGKVTLVLNSGEKDQVAIDATVLREDKESDLAILKVSGKVPALTALDLGSSDALVETQSLTSFGYPFGVALSETKDEMPSVSVSVGRITSLRKLKGVLQHVQLDASLNPGNSGGPVVDDKGKVIGIVQSGVPGAAVNFAIPVSRLTALIEKPDIAFTPPPLSFAKRSDPAEFAINVSRFDKRGEAYSVELTLPGDGDLTRKLTAKAAADGVYKVTAAPLPAKTGPERLAVSLAYSNGTLTGKMVDQDLAVGDKTYKLSAVSRIEGGAAPTLTLRSGEKINGAVKSAELPVVLGEVTLKVDPSKAARMDISPADPAPSSVAYTITVKSGDKVVGELTGSIGIDAVPSVVSTGGGTTVGSIGAIREPVLTAEKTTIKLAAPVDDVIEAGGGRFLLLHIKKLRQLGVFDVNEGKVVKYIPLAGDDIRVTAGMEKLILVSPDQNIIARWSLKTFEKEMTLPLEAAGQLDAVLMGSASAGPLMIMTRGGLVFFDVDTLKKMDVKFGNNGGGGFGNWMAHPQYPLRVCASADGTTFAAWEPGLSPSGVRILRIDGLNVTSAYQHDSAGELMPSYDGSMLFTGSGIYSADLKRLQADQFRNISCLPSSHPSYFIGIAYSEDEPGNGKQKLKVNVYTSGDKKLLLTIPNLEDISTADRWGNGGQLSVSKRIHLIPSANLLVTIPESRDQLTLRKLDLLAEMEKAGIDYFFVASQPKLSADKGMPYAYPIEVKSKRGGTSFKLETGPEGMTVSAKGEIRWSVPANYPPGQAAVIVSLKDASGQELYHSFNISVK